MKYFFLTVGRGKAKEKLVSFEFALREAGIARYNLVKVSSILPPNAMEIEKERLWKILKPGEILHGAYVTKTFKRGYHALCVAVAIPFEREMHGFIVECENNKSKKDAEERALEILKECYSSLYSGPYAVKVRSIEAKGDGKTYTTLFAGVMIF